jgi:hypothetical protein
MDLHPVFTPFAPRVGAGLSQNAKSNLAVASITLVSAGGGAALGAALGAAAKGSAKAAGVGGIIGAVIGGALGGFTGYEAKQAV